MNFRFSGSFLGGIDVPWSLRLGLRSAISFCTDSCNRFLAFLFIIRLYMRRSSGKESYLNLVENKRLVSRPFCVPVVWQKSRAGDALAAAGRHEEGRAEYEKALRLAKAVEPELRVRRVLDIGRRLAGR